MIGKKCYHSMRFPFLKQRNDSIDIIERNRMRSSQTGCYWQLSKSKKKKLENGKIKYSHFCIQLYDYTVVYHNRILTDIQVRN